MKRLVIVLSLVGLCVASAVAVNLDVELVFARRSWTGTLQGRDGDMVLFLRDGRSQTVPIGISTIQEIKFKVKIDEQKIQDMLNQHQYDLVIQELEAVLRPFNLYRDIPSNLTPYSFKLMQVYFWNKDFDKSIELSESIMLDDKNPDLQKKASIFRVLAYIEAGRLDEAQQMMDDVGNETDENSLIPVAAKLYTQAKILALRGSKAEALEVAAKVVAFHSQDTDWMPPAELLCAEMYAELGYYDSAQEVIYEIGILHKSTPEFDKANKLKLSVDRMRAEAAAKELQEEE